jgi:hypothetical protein
MGKEQKDCQLFLLFNNNGEAEGLSAPSLLWETVP